MANSKKEVTNNELYKLIKGMDSKITSNTSLIKSNAELIKGLGSKIKFNTDSIDNLAISVKEGFDSVDKRFDKIDQHLKMHDNDLDDIKLRFTEVAHTLEVKEIAYKVNVLELKVKKLETRR
ncbi:MAG: hypothetical protein ABIG10_03315 [bacterium]